MNATNPYESPTDHRATLDPLTSEWIETVRVDAEAYAAMEIGKVGLLYGGIRLFSFFIAIAAASFGVWVVGLGYDRWTQTGGTRVLTWLVVAPLAVAFPAVCLGVWAVFAKRIQLWRIHNRLIRAGREYQYVKYTIGPHRLVVSSEKKQDEYAWSELTLWENHAVLCLQTERNGLLLFPKSQTSDQGLAAVQRLMKEARRR